MASYLFYFVLFFYWSKPYVHGALVPNHHHVIQLKSLQPELNCSAPARGLTQQSYGLQITHRYGPCSPLHQQNSSPNSHPILYQDQYRVSSINSRTSSIHPMGESGDGTRLSIYGRSIGAGNYVVTVGFGTPKRDFALIVDTGSAITWIQCKPCSVSCYPQQDPIFDPSSSSTYSNASCSTPICDYSIQYADKSHSKGHIGRDTLTLTPSDVVQDFFFGCGQDNSADFGTAAGMLGLGQEGEGLSLISQTWGQFAKIFCYCLPATESSTGHLLFGLEALKTCQTKISTPLITNPKRPTLYFVNLLGITIGQQRLEVSSFVSSSPSTIIDSGTVITRLPSSVYSKLRDAFKQSMSKYPPAPPSPPLLDTCYNLQGHMNVTIPQVVLHFEKSTDIILDRSGVLWTESDSQVCLAFAGNTNANDLTIIGNNQQQKLNVLFDIQEKKVQFGTGGC